MLGWRKRSAIRKYEYDPQRASQRLAELGWRRGEDGILANAAGERLVLPWQLEAGDTDLEKFQSVTAAQWKSAVGIDSTVNTLSRAAARVPETQATYPGLSAPGGDTTIQNLNLWWHSNAIPRPENRWTGNNRAGWANPQANALLESILRELNPDRQQDILVELAQVWAQDLPALPIWFRAEVVAISSRLQNAQARANSSGIYSTMWNVADWDTQ